MRPGPETSFGSEPLAVETAQGRLAFHRTGESQAALEVEYRTPGLLVHFEGPSPEAGVEAACAHEIVLMRATLAQLGETLAGQLSDEGKPTRVTRQWKNSEERDWAVGDGAFQVQGTRYSAKERIQVGEGTSEAKLVQETVRLLIEQREENIRHIYGQILSDQRLQRSGEQRGQSDEMGVNPHA
jgi:hypothetical protein